MRDKTQWSRAGSRAGLVCFLATSAMSVACASARMPPPEEAAAAYSQALESGDAAALHQMLTSQARENISEEEVKAELERNKAEHSQRAVAFSGAEPVVVEGEASLFLQGGHDVVLSLEGGGFALSSGSVLPSRPLTPEQAARDFALALAMRNYERIEGALSERGKKQLAEVFDSLDEELKALDLAIFDVREDSAVVSFPSGMHLLLVREAGVWRIEELR